MEPLPPLLLPPRLRRRKRKKMTTWDSVSSIKHLSDKLLKPKFWTLQADNYDNFVFFVTPEIYN